MVERKGKNWGLRAIVCAAVVVWQIYDMASASVLTSNGSNVLRCVVIGAALLGLVASLLKLSADY